MSDSILEIFKVESLKLIGELNGVVKVLENSHQIFPSELLEEFSQKIDRIMGTAQVINELNPKHLGLKRIGTIAELCKKIGYGAVEKKDVALLPIFAAFWADTLEVIGELLNALENEKATEKISREFSEVVQSRLEWLAKKVSPQKADPALDIQDLLNKLRN
ncbi:MAG: hypothetical protein AABZ55_04445 [Bdellovibrionota bacterium]